LRALLVAPVLVFAFAASSHLEIRCALTGLVMPDCCPGAEPAFAPAPKHASMSERDCCQRTVVAAAKLPLASSEPGFQGAPLAVGRPLPLLLEQAVPSLEARHIRTDSGSLASSPPAFLLTHAFLI
jgi:hypothetical protein